MIRKEFFKGIRYPYLTNAAPNKRHDGINIARAAYAIDPSILEVEFNEKNNEKLQNLKNGDSKNEQMGGNNLTRKIIDKKKLRNITLKNKDILEIVHFIGGG